MSDLVAATVKHGKSDWGETNELKDMIVNHVGEDEYSLLADFQRGEMILYLFVRKDLESISSVTVARAENTGIGGVMANKGGIATSLTVGSTRVAFV